MLVAWGQVGTAQESCCARCALLCPAVPPAPQRCWAAAAAGPGLAVPARRRLALKGLTPHQHLPEPELLILL